MRHRGEAAGVAWAPMLCSGYLVVSPFDLLRARVPPRAWVRVRVRVRVRCGAVRVRVRARLSHVSHSWSMVDIFRPLSDSSTRQGRPL